MSRTVFITGANGGLGLATTKIFLSRGWNVVATARSPSASEALQGLLGDPDNDRRLLLHPLDLLSEETFRPAIDAAAAKFGTVDVLVQNAGYGQSGMLEALSVDEYRRQFEVNVFGPISLTKVFLLHCLAGGDLSAPRTIVYISSGAAHFSVPLMSAYNSSKSALDMFAEAVSFELRELKPRIKVKIVVPHGGMNSTSFGVSSNDAPVQERIAQRPELRARYGALTQKVMERVVRNPGIRMPIERPAMKVWEAATDGTDRLRYFIGPEDGGEKLAKRLEGRKEGESVDETDDRYVRWMRAIFE